MKKNKLVISEDTQMKIIEMVQNGETYLNIARTLGVGKNTITRCIRYHDIPVMQKDKAIKEKDNIIKDFNDGLLMNSIAKKYNITMNILRTLLKNYNIKLRGQGHYRPEINEEQIQRIISMYDNKITISQISKDLGYNSKFISSILKKNNRDTKNRNKKDKHGNWKGGRLSCGNYIYIKIYPDNPFFCMTNTAGYILEHRYILAQYYNRPLLDSETVHHKDGNSRNNDIDNLELRQGKHGKGQCWECQECGSRNIKAVEL